MARLTLRVPQGDQIPGLTVTRAGVSLSAPSWNQPLPTDPGRYEIRAEAPGYTPFVTVVELSEGATTEVEVALEQGSATPSPRPAPDTPLVVLPEPARDAADESVQAPVGWVVFGVGAASAIVGASFGGAALSREADANTLCGSDADLCPSPEGIDASADARTFATLSNVFVFAGLGLATAGIVTVLTAPGGEDLQDVEVAVSPTGASFRARW